MPVFVITAHDYNHSGLDQGLSCEAMGLCSRALVGGEVSREFGVGVSVWRQ